MAKLTNKDKKLLRQLFNPVMINHFVQNVPGTVPDEWNSLFSKLLGVNSKSIPGKGIDLQLFIDGSASYHKKRAGIGGVFYKVKGDKVSGDELFIFSEHIGEATSNEAEYKALIRGLDYAKQFDCGSISIKADSELVVRQVNGKYRVKNTRLKKLHQIVNRLLSGFSSWEINYIPRGQNKRADKLSRQGMNRED